MAAQKSATQRGSSSSSQRSTSARRDPEGNQAPSALAVWLGIAESSFQKQKTVHFGDPSTVTPGRIWSIFTLVFLGVLWTLSAYFNWTSPIFWPSPQAVGERLVTAITEGYRNFTLWQHIGYSVFRVIVGVLCGAVLGIPLGFAMGLSTKLRGLFDPIVEFMRPVPPLALIPLMVIWFGIGETAKIMLLFLAALWIMTLAARAGVFSVSIPKVHAAYSLGATRSQLLRHVILPNALPEIFTGLRTSMGVCWTTVVAAELVAANKGLGFMIMAASKFMASDLVVVGIVLIGIIGFLIEMAMRKAEQKLIPWKGKV
ncbi:MAG: putative aliphatic sulfonates transport permease protein SsuC [Gammaproteobacteria bacterium]|nr:putative aliphatic sulfonates transport permease protein SsuC [Gammaproteobacteria bacterium]